MTLFSKIHKNNKGLSLVELIITIALMVIVSAGVAAAVLSSTRNYSKNSSEVEIQQDVQTVSNILTNLILDSVKVQSSGTGTETDPVILNITSSENEEYVLSWTSTGKVLNYSKDGSVNTPLAEHVEEFSVNTATYSSNYKVHFNIAMSGKEGKVMYSAFSVTSRNAKGADIATDKDNNGAVILAEGAAVIEPLQSISIPFNVLLSGNLKADLSNNNLSCSIVSTTDSTTSVSISQTDKADNGSVVITAGANEKAEKFFVILSTTSINSETSLPYAQKTITVNVRRVNSIDINGRLTNGTNMKKNARYEVGIDDFTVINGERFFALTTDDDYVSPYKVKWVLSGDTGYINVTSRPTGSGSGTDTDPLIVDGITSKWVFTLPNDFPEGASITFTCYALHPDQYNKTSGQYSVEVLDSWSLEKGFFDNVPDSDFKRSSEAGSIWSYPSGYDNLNKLIEQYFLPYYTPYLDHYTKYNTVKKAIQDHSSADFNDIKSLINYNGGLDSIKSSYLTDVKNAYNFTFTVFGSVGSYYDLNDKSKVAWSRYIPLQGITINGVDQNYTIDKLLSYAMDADKEYQFEFVCVFSCEEKATGNKYILWPNYSKLLTSGMGFAEDGYQNAPFMSADPVGKSPSVIINGSNKAVFDSGSIIQYVSPYKQNGYASYARTMKVAKGGFKFIDPVTSSSVETLGSEYDPYIIKYDGEFNLMLSSDMKGLGTNEFMHTDAKIQYQKDDGTWETLDESIKAAGKAVNLETKSGIVLLPGNSYYKFQHQNSDYPDTLFRLCVTLSGRPRAYAYASDGAYSNKLHMSSNSKSGLSGYYQQVYDILPMTDYTYPLYDEESDTGFFYFKVADKNGHFTGEVKPNVTVNLNPNGGTCSKSSITVYQGKTCKALVDPVYPGYRFLGWYTALTDGNLITQDSTYNDLVGASTLYAHWEEIPKVVLIIDPNGGSVAVTSLTVYEGEQLDGLVDAVPGDNKKLFDGWYTEANGGSPVYNGDSYESLVGVSRIYAHYRDKETIVINLVAGDGTINGGVTSISFLEGDPVPNLPNVTPANVLYNFTGWFTSSSGGKPITNGTLYSEVKGITTLYAQYEKNPAGILLDYNDGTGQTGATFYSNNGHNINNLPNVTKAGFGFAGWFTLPSGGTSIYNGYYVNDAYSINTLYAQYYPLRIYLNPNGGTVDNAYVDPQNGGAVWWIPNAKLDGKEFDGWWTSPTGGTKLVYSNSAATILGSGNTLYAHWK